MGATQRHPSTTTMAFRGDSRGRGGFRGGDRGRGSFGFGGRGGGRGGFQQQSFGPPAQVFELGTFLHASEGEMVCESVNPKIPYFNAPIYLENKTSIGKVDEVVEEEHQEVVADSRPWSSLLVPVGCSFYSMISALGELP